jgi:hypothetical protein
MGPTVVKYSILSPVIFEIKTNEIFAKTDKNWIIIHVVIKMIIYYALNRILKS